MSAEVRSAGPSLPDRVRRGAVAVGVQPHQLSPAGGATGHTWTCGDLVLRVGPVAVVARERVAMAAAAPVVPVPALVAAADFRDAAGQPWSALLLTRLAGRPAGELLDRSPDRLRRVGAACGSLHAAIGSVPAPRGLPLVLDGGGPVGAGGLRLLHGDLHPLNVLVDERDEVSGVVDWCNAGAGHTVLDRARTWSILTLDPAAVRLVAERPALAALNEGWGAAAGWTALPASARVTACRTMLEDLAGRYTADALDHVRTALREAAEGLRDG